jgi:hypothetical protein
VWITGLLIHPMEGIKVVSSSWSLQIILPFMVKSFDECMLSFLLDSGISVSYDRGNA